MHSIQFKIQDQFTFITTPKSQNSNQRIQTIKQRGKQIMKNQNFAYLIFNYIIIIFVDMLRKR